MKSLATKYKLNRSEEHTSELQSQSNLVCRLLLEKNETIASTGSGYDRRRSAGRAAPRRDQQAEAGRRVRLGAPHPSAVLPLRAVVFFKERGAPEEPHPSPPRPLPY